MSFSNLSKLVTTRDLKTFIALATSSRPLQELHLEVFLAKEIITAAVGPNLSAIGDIFCKKVLSDDVWTWNMIHPA